MASTEATPSVRPTGAVEVDQLDITAKSVLYQPDNGVPTCIVILDISFIFKNNTHLQSATLPITVTALAKEPTSDFCFHANLPDANKEFVVIDQSVVQKDATFKPGIEVGLAPVGPSLKISGLGIEKKWEESVEKWISLGGQCLGNQQRVRWNFDNSSRTIYPDTTTVMVIVKKTETKFPLFFPFELHLAPDFEIDGFGGKKWWRFKAGSSTSPSTSSRHIGIRGNYNEGLARRAFEDIEKFSEEPSVVGLRVAMRSFAERRLMVRRV